MAGKKSYPNVENFPYGTCPAGKLMVSSRLISNVYKKYFKQHKITLSQWGLMSTIAHFRKLPQAELGRIMALERSTVSRDLQRLLDKGFIQKKGAVNRLQVEITETGLDFVERVIPDWEKAKREANEVLGAHGLSALDLIVARSMQQTDEE